MEVGSVPTRRPGPTPDLDDALPMYEHYRDKSGTPMTFDFEEGYQEDLGIRREVNGEMKQTLAAANELVKAGYTSIDFHSGVKGASDANYPQTENWCQEIKRLSGLSRDGKLAENYRRSCLLQ